MSAPIPPKGALTPLGAARYLTDSGRMDWTDFAAMLRRGIYVMGPGWLPCHDDSQRDQFEEYLSEGEDEEPEVPSARMRCPLQVRAALGDQFAPCAEVQELRPPESLVRAARRSLPDGLPERSERQPDPAEGTAADPVRQHGLRPCQLLGPILATGLEEYLRRLEDPAWWDADLRLLGISVGFASATTAEWTG